MRSRLGGVPNFAEPNADADYAAQVATALSPSPCNDARVQCLRSTRDATDVRCKTARIARWSVSVLGGGVGFVRGASPPTLARSTTASDVARLVVPPPPALRDRP